LVGKANVALLVCGVSDMFLAEEGFHAFGLVLAQVGGGDAPPRRSSSARTALKAAWAVLFVDAP
jgi:hypothetical protein